MKRITRRNYVKGTLSAAVCGVGVGGASATPLRTPALGKPGIQLAHHLLPEAVTRHRLTRQVGVRYAIPSVIQTLSKIRREDYLEALTKIKSDFAKSDLAILGVESHPVPAEKIKLGLPGREEEIENYKAVIAALARVGIPMICYNFMPGLGPYRTRVDLPERGGALTSEFDNKVALAQGLTQWGEVSEQRIWDNIAYFLKEVMPVAEKYNIQMALHPDDPPLSPLRGIARIVVNARNYRRIMDLVPSPLNGITFCQANFLAMGEDIEALAKEWCAQKKIFFVHFRDVVAKPGYFRETFHDNGPTDMARMLQIYHEAGFRGPMRPDHAPTLEGEPNDVPGYAMQGQMLAFGYMKGIMDALRIPYE
ncbi:MAG: mannonate dehydratase, partial [Bryobacterales bacterium]|nr:mannonate dehydratase [Bryobacterales bacterium]